MAIDHVTRTWPYDPVGMIAWFAGALQVPVLLGIAWWDALRDAQTANRHHADGAAPDHALIVPQPIEIEGEHALFA